MPGEYVTDLMAAYQEVDRASAELSRLVYSAVYRRMQNLIGPAIRAHARKDHLGVPSTASMSDGPGAAAAPPPAFSCLKSRPGRSRRSGASCC
jgi:hypothetical protein